MKRTIKVEEYNACINEDDKIYLIMSFKRLILQLANLVPKYIVTGTFYDTII